MELILGIVSFLWMITLLVVYKGISTANITVNVKHENAITEVSFSDLYDKDGEIKKEHEEEINFNEVFKEFNELMTGNEVESNG